MPIHPDPGTPLWQYALYVLGVVLVAWSGRAGYRAYMLRKGKDRS